MRAKDLLLDATRRVIASASGTGKAVGPNDGGGQITLSYRGWQVGDLVDPEPSERTVLVQFGHLSAMPTASANVRSDSTSLGALPRASPPYEGLIRAFEP